jgi:hypothetical protein
MGFHTPALITSNRQGEEETDSDRHLSLLPFGINYARKKFYSTAIEIIAYTERIWVIKNTGMLLLHKWFTIFSKYL